MLAALLAIGNAQHVNFRRMSSTGTAAGVKADTGYAAPVIGYLWRKYRTQLINRVRGAVRGLQGRWQRWREGAGRACRSLPVCSILVHAHLPYGRRY